ncbi:hypothetical protein BMJ19_10645 [Sinorhizobium medicae]|nr:hypothetical protein BMJ31_29090 [Sinorhizobium medicae]PLU37339.1 hypothetical protein BMJ28_12850 [Sinorhizobium medicae]PLU80013.1 hypothetical protein BMJ19_10645 [Sinorhizobium medicae]
MNARKVALALSGTSHPENSTFIISSRSALTAVVTGVKAQWSLHWGIINLDGIARSSMAELSARYLP